MKNKKIKSTNSIQENMVFTKGWSLVRGWLYSQNMKGTVSEKRGGLSSLMMVIVHQRGVPL